ncbi:MAG: 30S ribosomal protein S4e [Candidatus Aenigmarchaeota archaeon]|nr:30S ribosomal protein S4e [Candidatus Aenigmarchaeota archaeon]
MGRHLKPLSTPKFWRIARKSRPWVVKPNPGSHKKDESMPLLIILRDILKLVDTAAEGQKIISSREVFVDGKYRRSYKYPVGFMDVLQIPKLNKFYRIVSSKRGLSLNEISEKEINLKLCRIRNKTLIKKGKLQLNLHDGRNILVERKGKKDDYSTGDSLLIELPSQKIVEHIKLENGNLGLIIGGQNQGELIKVKGVVKTRSREPNKVICDLKGREFASVKDYVFVVGKAKPMITVNM